MSRTFTSLSDPELIRIINNGAIGVLATDTVYGLVAQASSHSALERFYSAKPRHYEPGTIIGASIEQFLKIGFSLTSLQIAAQYWPGAVSVVLDAQDVANSLKHHRDSLAVRIPEPIELQALLTSTGPLMTTSANAPGEPTAHTTDEAKDYFGDTVDFYVDSGPIDNPPSTILGIDSNHKITVFRQGSVPIL